MQYIPKMEEVWVNLRGNIERKGRALRYTPADELFHGDPFLDDMLSTRVNQWQSWVLRCLVLGCHLVEEPTRVTEQIPAQRSSYKKQNEKTPMTFPSQSPSLFQPNPLFAPALTFSPGFSSSSGRIQVPL